MNNILKYIGLILIIVGGAALTQLFQSSRVNSSDTHFTYDSANRKSEYVHVVTGIPVEVPFEFQIGREQQEVEFDFELADDSFSGKGISLTESTVSVAAGAAASTALFEFNKNDKLSPGTYYLKVVAKDKTTGEVVRTGEIPFIVDMHEIVSKCSC